jgi:hypothetical protein
VQWRRNPPKATSCREKKKEKKESYHPDGKRKEKEE